MSTTIHKQTYSGGQAYRYHVSDEAGDTRYVAEPTGLQLPRPTRLVEFFDPDHHRVGRLQPFEVAPWQYPKRYELFAGEEAEEPYAVIYESMRLVDVLLLRLPRYELQLGQHRYVARGSRYGDCFYQIFPAPAEEAGEVGEEQAGREVGESEPAEPAGKSVSLTETSVGRIRCPKAGPSYVVETDAAPLRQAPTVVAALVILIDLEQTA